MVEGNLYNRVAGFMARFHGDVFGCAAIKADGDKPF